MKCTDLEHSALSEVSPSTTVNTILLVDPDTAVGELMTLFFEGEGYGLVVVRSLREAAKALVDHHFDLVITEAFGQTEYFAFDPLFLGRLRSLTGNTPIVLSSTYTSIAHLRAGDFGLADVVPKPFDLAQIEAAVRQAFRAAERAPSEAA
jgi:DNA-binding response OmpR family regulator